jgi:hypothetical protein
VGTGLSLEGYRPDLSETVGQPLEGLVDPAVGYIAGRRAGIPRRQDRAYGRRSA